MSEREEFQRLPDIPNSGFATTREKQLSDVMMYLIRGLERDRLFLLEVVIQGKLRWRKVFCEAYRAIKADADIADAVFGYLELLAGANPHAQKARLELQGEQQRRAAWDMRRITQAQHLKDRISLETDIDRELRKVRKTYGA